MGKGSVECHDTGTSIDPLSGTAGRTRDGKRAITVDHHGRSIGNGSGARTSAGASIADFKSPLTHRRATGVCVRGTGKNESPRARLDEPERARAHILHISGKEDVTLAYKFPHAGGADAIAKSTVHREAALIAADAVGSAGVHDPDLTAPDVISGQARDRSPIGGGGAPAGRIVANAIDGDIIDEFDQRAGTSGADRVSGGRACLDQSDSGQGIISLQADRAIVGAGGGVEFKRRGREGVGPRKREHTGSGFEDASIGEFSAHPRIDIGRAVSHIDRAVGSGQIDRILPGQGACGVVSSEPEDVRNKTTGAPGESVTRPPQIHRQIATSGGETVDPSRSGIELDLTGSGAHRTGERTIGLEPCTGAGSELQIARRRHGTGMEVVGPVMQLGHPFPVVRCVRENRTDTVGFADEQAEARTRGGGDRAAEGCGCPGVAHSRRRVTDRDRALHHTVPGGSPECTLGRGGSTTPGNREGDPATDGRILQPHETVALHVHRGDSADCIVAADHHAAVVSGGGS